MSALTQSLAPRKLRVWHQEIIDLWIANPTMSQGEIARRLGRTQAWVSIVVNSDAFRAKFAERKSEFVDPILAATVEDRLRGVAAAATERLLERIEGGQISNKDLISAVAVSTKGLGMGAPAPAPSVQQNLYYVSAPAPSATRSAWQEAVDATMVLERAQPPQAAAAHVLSPAPAP